MTFARPSLPEDPLTLESSIGSRLRCRLLRRLEKPALGIDLGIERRDFGGAAVFGIGSRDASKRELA